MSRKHDGMLQKDLRGLRDVLRAPGAFGKWQALRHLVQSNHGRLWAQLREYRHFINDLREDWDEQGMHAVGRHCKRLVVDSVEAIKPKRRSRMLWLDVGDLGDLCKYYGGEPFHDHGLGLLRTIMHRDGVETDIASTRNARTMAEVTEMVRGYDILLMNVRSYRYDMAVESARCFKAVNPNGIVCVGGMHTMVDQESMEKTPEFDKICIGAGETIISDLVRDPDSFPRIFTGKGAKSMGEWPVIDRTLWPKPASWMLRFKYNWPLEAGLGWGPRPVVSVLTSRVCPWQCSFCNEASYIASMGRRPVEAVIDEINELDEKYRIGSVVIHDSMFFQQRGWLEQWRQLYPKRARKLWPYWAAGRADTVCEWPDLFEALIRETNWNTVSIGFESGSDPVLKILNKQVTEAENQFVIDLVNRIGDDQERAGEKPVEFWSNVMLAIPGETREDAFKTVRMIKRMKRARPSVAFYSPFPGSALGYQLLAEGKNMTEEDYRRNPRDEKVKGIDYQFYRDLLLGRFDDEVNRGLTQEEQRRVIPYTLGFDYEQL